MSSTHVSAKFRSDSCLKTDLLKRESALTTLCLDSPLLEGTEQPRRASRVSCGPKSISVHPARSCFVPPIQHTDDFQSQTVSPELDRRQNFGTEPSTTR